MPKGRDVPPHSEEDEAAVLGAILLTDVALPRVLVDVGLKADHFYRPKHGETYGAMVTLYDRGEPVDVLTVVAELERSRDEDLPERDKAYVSGLPTVVPAVGAVVSYAERVVELWELRQKQQLFREGLEAVATENRERMVEAEAGLGEVGRRKAANATPEQIAHELWAYLESGPAECFELPFAKLSDGVAGGLRRGALTLVGGHSSHGKSAFLDQCLDEWGWATGPDGRPYRVHLYLTEMTRHERSLRWLARKTRVPHLKLAKNRLSDRDRDKVAKALEHPPPYGITDAAGWSAEEIAFDVRRNRWDLFAVDILHEIEHDDERDLARIGRQLQRAAIQANAVGIATVHLNEHRSAGKGLRPPPVLGDIRGSGSLKNGAANVMFVWRDQDEEKGGRLLPEGFVYWSKVRNGELTRQKTKFLGETMRFVAAGAERESDTEGGRDVAF